MIEPPPGALPEFGEALDRRARELRQVPAQGIANADIRKAGQENENRRGPAQNIEALPAPFGARPGVGRFRFLRQHGGALPAVLKLAERAGFEPAVPAFTETIA